MKKQLFILGLVSILTFSCTCDDDLIVPPAQEQKGEVKEDENVEETTDPNKTELSLITGLTHTNAKAEIVQTFGNPNDHVSFCRAYPNPAVSDLSINSTVGIKKVWLVKGEPQNVYPNFDFTSYYQSTTIDTIGLESNAQFNWMPRVSVNKLTISVGNFPKGYFRLIVQNKNDVLNWTTVYLATTDEDLNTIVSTWDEK